MIGFFNDLFISEKLGVSKPTKEFFDVCMKGANAKVENSIMIGDSLTADIIGAKEYGMATIWYNHNREFVENKSADYVVYDLIDIKEIL